MRGHGGEVYAVKSGEIWDPEWVSKARAEELDFVTKFDLFVEVPVEECGGVAGRILVNEVT